MIPPTESPWARASSIRRIMAAAVAGSGHRTGVASTSACVGKASAPGGIAMSWIRVT